MAEESGGQPVEQPVLLKEGAYAKDGETRPELLRAALTRAGADPKSVVFIGDTPADVAGGLETGVRVVAVATGRTAADELRDADDVLADLSETDRVLEALGT
ncbi:HAD family hydrolase [Streptomyces krungchingensis]